MTLLSRVLNHHDKNSRLITPVSLNTSRRLVRNPRVGLRINLESPPVVLYGLPTESTGSIILGVLKLEILPDPKHDSSLALSPRTSALSLALSPHASSLSLYTAALSPQLSAASVTASEIMMHSVVLLLVQTMHYTKPFVVQLTHIALCDHCATRTNTLARWDALLESMPFNVGSHAYPFSHLIPGLLAATTKLGGALSHSHIRYDLIAVAKSAAGETTLVVPVNILRLILRGPDRNSQRVFPPTEVTANAVLPNVMYPKSTFPVELRMDNVVNDKGDRRWRMRKLSWKLEEHTYVRAYACPTHQGKLQAIEELHRKAQRNKSLKGANDPMRSASLHHLTVQTLLYYGPPPSSASRTEQLVPLPTMGSAAGNRDTVVETVEQAPSNRPTDEAVHFDEDFSRRNMNNPDTNTQSAPATALANALALTNATGSGLPQVGLPSTQPRDQLFLDELRVVAHGDVKSGWKSDFSGKGRIELVVDVVGLGCSTGLRPHVSSKSSADASHDDVPGMLNEATVSCDIDDPELGIYVSHVLVVEVIVAEELVQPLRRGEGLSPVTSTGSNSSTSGSVGVPTGSARVLRMQFKVNVTERSGLGIAWDAEVPPTYDDVQALSPPTYESLASGTPLTAPNVGLPLIPPPAVLYGLGSTPFVGSYNNATPSIDQVTEAEESIQELHL